MVEIGSLMFGSSTMLFRKTQPKWLAKFDDEKFAKGGICSLENEWREG